MLYTISIQQSVVYPRDGGTPCHLEAKSPSPEATHTWVRLRDALLLGTAGLTPVSSEGPSRVFIARRNSNTRVIQKSIE